MEEKNLTEQESLDLIRKMLEQTRVRIQTGSNKAEMWIGCLGMAISVITYIGVEMFHCQYVHLLWFLMFLSFFIGRHFKKKEALPETYVSKAINTAFCVLGWTFGIACLTFALFLYEYRSANTFAILFPLSFIIMSFVTLLKGLLLEEKIYRFSAYVVMLMGFYLMGELFVSHVIHTYWILAYTGACFFQFVLPNLIFDYKMKVKR